MGKKTNVKRIGAIIAAMIMTSCSCFTINANANYENLITESNEKTLYYLELGSKSSDLVSQDLYSISRSQYSCDVYFNMQSSGTMTLTLKKQNNYGSWNYYDSCSINFTNAWFTKKSKNISLPSGVYRIYVNITSNNGDFDSNSVDFSI